MKLQPLSNRVFIEAIEAEHETASGIVLPKEGQEKPQMGKVIAVGPGKLDDSGKRMKMNVKIGDTVLYKKYGPDEIELEGKKYLVADEEDIVAIIYN
ncbi:MAG: co-chaperone GroES [bacterium]|nr:co-chaperone GroES [bacterium]